MPQIKIYNGSSWIEPNVKVRGASSWLDPEMKYYSGTAWQTLEGAAVAPTVSARADGRFNSILSSTCYCGCAFYTSGLEYEYTAAGSLTNSTTWLDSGISDDVWVMWTRTGGTLSDWNSIGSGNNNVRLNITTTRGYRMVRNAAGTSTIIGYFRFYDAASGGNLLDTTAGATWSAEYDFDPCPLCCFTPDTPVTLASGIEVAIGTVREGDEILVWNPFTKDYDSELVEEIIIREKRAMYLVTFSDGRSFRVSDDHPIHVKGKGAASINPVGDYKDLGKPEKIHVGDSVTLQDGTFVTVASYERIDYPGLVYTFGNSMFFANGVCVY